jgi:hypothetical protein
LKDARELLARHYIRKGEKVDKKFGFFAAQKGIDVRCGS